jgi:LacI family transcriptional regulator
MNYQPNLNARSLKNGSSRTIGIITEDFTVFNTPFIMDSIAAACDEAGYHYIISNLRFFQRFGNVPSHDVESEAVAHATVRDMFSRQVDGIVYLGCHSHRIVSLAEYQGVRFVCAYCISNDPSIPYINYNDEKAAFEVTELLISKGASNIGMITGPVESLHAANRIRGQQEALYAGGVPYNPRLTLTGDWERDSGYLLAESLVNMKVDAIFAHNDVMALGVLDYCNKKGIAVGEDLLLIGFDNREISKVCRPALSTVALPLYEIGQTAIRLMLEMLRGEDLSNIGEITLDCSIVERESTLGS